ncbi:Armadillo-like helical containing protein [Cryptosporidium parvum]|nr:Armadillo-like helical containing protein [Cryptosporidium parvum]
MLLIQIVVGLMMKQYWINIVQSRVKISLYM